MQVEACDGLSLQLRVDVHLEQGVGGVEMFICNDARPASLRTRRDSAAVSETLRKRTTRPPPAQIRVAESGEWVGAPQRASRRPLGG